MIDNADNDGQSLSDGKVLVCLEACRLGLSLGFGGLQAWRLVKPLTQPGPAQRCVVATTAHLISISLMLIRCAVVATTQDF